MDTDRLRAGLRWEAQQHGGDEADAARRSAALVPAGRFGTATEFGQVCGFLCSVHAGYMTAQNVLVDGGLKPTAF